MSSVAMLPATPLAGDPVPTVNIPPASTGIDCVVLVKSKLDGIAVRIGTPNLRGFQWYTTMGHNRARFFPEAGGPFRPPLLLELQEL